MFLFLARHRLKQIIYYASHDQGPYNSVGENKASTVHPICHMIQIGASS